MKCVGFQRSGVKYEYVDLRAAYVAFMKLPLVLVCPHEDVKQSATPANESIFFIVGEPTTPLPRGAGTKRIRTEPLLPASFIGTVCGAPMRFPQYPRRTGMRAIFAAMMPPRIAVATSLAHFWPRPMWPLESPTK